MASQALMDKLNDILRHEWTGLAQYAQASFVVTGVWREVYAEMFSDSAKECFGHANLIGDKIVALGGIPSLERNQIHQTKSLREMLEAAYEFESKAVTLYNEALNLAEDDRALVVFLEDILKEEQEGVDDIGKLLRENDSALATDTATKAG